LSILLMVVCLIFCVNPVVCQSKTVKPKKGYYVATGDDNNCLVIKKVKGNKITFQLGWYSELNRYIKTDNRYHKKRQGKIQNKA
jgi:hypothetical protein